MSNENEIEIVPTIETIKKLREIKPKEFESLMEDYFDLGPKSLENFSDEEILFLESTFEVSMKRLSEAGLSEATNDDYRFRHFVRQRYSAFIQFLDWSAEKLTQDNNIEEQNMMSETTEIIPDTEDIPEVAEKEKVFKSSYDLKQEAMQEIADYMTSPPICDPMTGNISVPKILTKLYSYRQKDNNYLPEIIPYNIASGKSYDDILNQMILLQTDKQDTRWMTFDQAKERGSFIQKGIKGTRIFGKKQEVNNTGGINYLTKSFVVFNASDLKSVTPRPTLSADELSAVATDGFYRLDGYCRKIDCAGDSPVQSLQNFSDKYIPDQIKGTQRALISALFTARKMAEFMQPVSETVCAFNYIKLNKNEIDKNYIDTVIYSANRLSYTFDQETGLDKLKKVTETQRIVYPKFQQKKNNQEMER